MEQGKCPKCNSNNITYAENEYSADQMGYVFDCNDCEFEGVEWYRLEYIESIERE